MKDMIRTLTAVLCAGVGLCTSAAYAQQPVTVDKIVAVVGNSAVLYSEVEETAKKVVEDRRQRGYTSDRDPMNEALEGLMLQKMLYNQAVVDSVEINREAVAEYTEQQVQQMIEEAGSITALEAMHGKPIFDIKDDLRFEIEEAQYAQSMQSEIMNRVRITPGEVERFYRSMDRDSLPIIPEQYVYAQITRYPRSTKEAKQRVRERLLEMRERIINGADFQTLARMYSVDPGSALKGGDMGYLPLDGLVKSYADVMSKLKPGQISEVVETEYGYHIIQLVDKKGNLYHSRHILLKPIFSNDELAEGIRFLDSLAGAIRRDSVSFEQAALKYSDDKYSKQNGGLVTNHEMLELAGANDTRYSQTKFFKDELGNDYQMLGRLKPGDVSQAFQTADIVGNVLSKIVKLVEVIPAHPAGLKNDYLRLEQLALQRKQDEEFDKWLDDKIDGMYIRIEPEFRDGDFHNKHWVK